MYFYESGELPVLTVVDFDIVVILKVLLFVSLSFVAVAFEFLSRRLFGFVFRLCTLYFVNRGETSFFIVHKQKIYSEATATRKCAYCAKPRLIFALLPRREFVLSVQTRTKTRAAISPNYLLGDACCARKRCKAKNCLLQLYCACCTVILSYDSDIVASQQ